MCTLDIVVKTGCYLRNKNKNLGKITGMTSKEDKDISYYSAQIRGQ
jgi:hypothetical protein